MQCCASHCPRSKVERTTVPNKAGDMANNHLFCLPPHTTHRLQSLNVGVFSPLSRAFKKQCLEVLDKEGDVILIQDFVKEYMIVRTNAETIRAAFRKSGIYSLNPDGEAESNENDGMGADMDKENQTCDDRDQEVDIDLPTQSSYGESSTMSWGGCCCRGEVKPGVNCEVKG